MYVKSGGAVQLTRNPDIPKVYKASSNASALLVVPCRVWTVVSVEQRPYCFSFVDPDRPHWFMRHHYLLLQMDSEFAHAYPHVFDVDASFLLLRDAFYLGHYALKSVNLPQYYINARDNGRLAIDRYEDTTEFRDKASFALRFRSKRKNDPYYSSCKEILNANTMAISGEYSIKTITGRILDKVYCEMGLNGGGYTFVNPKDLPSLTDTELRGIFTDRSSFLMRMHRTSVTTQPYGVLSQLAQHRGVELTVRLSEHSGYATPLNLNSLHTPYLYFGFLSTVTARASSVSGFKVNNATLVDITGTCTGEPSSYLALFPNFEELTPVGDRSNSALCSLFVNAPTPNPSLRLMPTRYFMFYETGWAGCHCSAETSSAAVGFR